MIWIVRMVLAVSAALSVIFEPRVFFGSDLGGGLLSFSSLYHSGSWWAFRLAVVALVSCGVVAFSGQPGSRVGWPEPVIAALLILFALVRGMPHSANQGTWSSGNVGALAWIRTERLQREGEPQEIGPEAFAGVWRAADGSAWTFTPNEATRTASPDSGSSAASKRAKCSGQYRVAYLERGRDVFVDRGIDSSSHAAATVAALPSRVRLPVATVACSDEPWAADFVRVAADELWLFEPWMTPEEFRDGAFVLRRFPSP